MKTRTKIINLFGGPGSGKSTTMAGVFNQLKTLGFNVEFVSEYAKDLAWEDNINLLQNQIHVFGEQFRRQWRLVDKVDYVITDSPLLLSSIYYEHYMDNSKNIIFTEEYRQRSIEFFDATFDEFNNVNFLIQRAKKYNPLGRVQTEEESINLDSVILEKIKNRNIVYNVTNSVDSVRDVINYITQNKQ